MVPVQVMEHNNTLKCAPACQASTEPQQRFDLLALPQVTFIRDQLQRLAVFNKVMSSQPGYPIEIDIYEDKIWEDFQNVLNEFGKNR